MDDLARQLPDPPSPRPAGRTAAIAAALARFDGDASPPLARTPLATSTPRWRIGRGPAGALASVVLVALIGIPVALLQPGRQAAAPQQTELRNVSPQGGAALDSSADVAPPAPAAMASNDLPPKRVLPPTLRQTNAAPVAVPFIAPAPPPEPVMAAPPPPPPPSPAPPPLPAPATPPPAAMVAAPEAKAMAYAPAARASVTDRAREDSARADIVVTGSRLAGAATRPIPRGDWNACTVDDPDRRLRGCREGTRGGGSEIAAHLSDGLTHAWQGDWDASIAAFDAAIALQPKLAIAHLNRGLAYWRAGDSGSAIADLDLAVRYAPTARSYYNRARLRRARGDRRGAQGDEARALELDPDYAEILKN